MSRNSLNLDITRTMQLATVLEDVLSECQMEWLTNYLPQYEYTVTVTIDGYNEITAVSSNEKAIKWLLWKLVWMPLFISNQSIKYADKAIRDSEEEWRDKRLPLEAWEEYQRWKDGKEAGE